MTIPISEAVKYNWRRKKVERLEDIIEDVREFILSRKYDIEMDIENYGMLKPVLNYFLEEAVDE